MLGNTPNPKPPLCTYSRVGFNCQRERRIGGEPFCLWHSPQSHQPGTPEYASHFNHLINERDGQWCGFTLPDDFKMEKMTVDFAIDARFTTGKKLSLMECIFTAAVDFSDSQFTDRAELVQSTFAEPLTFDRTTFENEFQMESTCNSRASFDRCIFKLKALFQGRFNGPTILSRSIFHDAVDFRGGRTHTLVVGAAQLPQQNPPPARMVFHDSVHLETIDFRRPERVLFRMVDLSKAFTIDTDFRKVRLDEIKWCSHKNRNGLYLEEWAKASHADSLIESNYRNIRAALEDGRDFHGATDFYIGEMEARRRQMSKPRRYFFSIEWLYWAASRYGGSPLRAFGVLFGLLFAYALLTAIPLGKVCWNSCELSSAPILRALSLLEISKAVENDNLTGWWRIFSIAFRVLVVIQVALLGLALRSRIKRA